MLEVRRYTADRAEEWNQFVAGSKNGTFLFDRGYMDYHSDRFRDHSLMCYVDQHLFALLPANEADGVLYSHQGLTYGGFVLGPHADSVSVMRMLDGVSTYLREAGFRHVIYKALPWIYCQQPSEELLYALTQVCQARLTVRELSTAIVLPRQPRWSRLRRRGMKRAQEAGVVVMQSDDFAAFWPVLDDNLQANHHVRPVHTVQEMQLLHSRFPQNIVLYVALRNGAVLGGVVMYLTPCVAHAQYSSATPEGKRLGVLDAIYDQIMHHDMRNYPYFDFGKSTENAGRYLNEHLIFQKEGFAGSGLCYDTYEWDL